MSKRRSVPDVDRTAVMVDLVRGSYPNGAEQVSLSHVVIEQVAPGTGWSMAQRWADVLALSVWPSKGLTLVGYEIKASRADLKRELADPGKHGALARYCDAWWLVVWDESVLVDGIPKTWGIYVTVEGDDGERELKTIRKVTPLKPEPWPRSFVCSLVRNAHVQSPGAAYVARVATSAYRRGAHEGENQAAGAERGRLEPLARALYGPNRYDWPPEAHDPEKLCQLAAARLTQGSLSLSTGKP